MLTKEAAIIMRQAFLQKFGKEPTFNELWFALTQTKAESSWGRGWKAPCDTSHNWGAVHASSGCLYREGGPSGGYDQFMRIYPNDVEGAKGYLYEGFERRPAVWAAARRGDIGGAAAALYDASYYTGVRCLVKNAAGKCIKADRDGNIADYAAFLTRHATPIRSDLLAAGYQPEPELGSGTPIAGPIIFVIIIVFGGTMALRSRKKVG